MSPAIKNPTLRLLSSGLYVLTVAYDGQIAAGTVNWLSQASFNPPLVMVGIRIKSRIHSLVEKSRTFAISIPAEGQKEIAQAFFRPSKIEPGRINGYPYESGPATGAPLLLDLPAWFEARVTDVVKGGDHTVFVAKVLNSGLRDEKAKPLALGDTKWSYGG